MVPVIKTSDVKTILHLVNLLNPTEKTKEVGQLMREIHRARTVPDNEMPGGVIQLNSHFEIRFAESGQVIAMKLVTPKYADISQQKLSLFSPLGVALIGFREGESVEWSLPGGTRSIEILKVNDPESVPVSQ
ncbi:regulator of nucleoside diphosphate kinase [Cyclobacterium lianum]|uniref:Regulator of nucleoside diphosphate kinase n=1 Tax=Cyclobacterium lianum TaxID=388280 RepID=A0A1M7N639_9BACT|nr:GreA/GreB family elongation factor [Cyclobacterium lianum]SHM98909.1 regulator of nucleoside diphosphate kinase [Cyclobacterium lianum]